MKLLRWNSKRIYAWKVSEVNTVAFLPTARIFDNSEGVYLIENKWSGREDLNLRPPGPEPGALPGCATPRPAAPEAEGPERRIQTSTGWLRHPATRGQKAATYLTSARIIKRGGVARMKRFEY